MLYKIESLTLYNSTRIALGGRTKLVYTPESPFQLIIGTNSSGKSSLLKELSPLPANLADYNEGGYKEIVISRNGAKYHIRSTKDTNKHSFMKDDVELNPSGGITIQRELVQSHFNLTEEIHDLLTDTILFTDMSPAERRRWITMMNPLDLTYALKMFQNTKTALRDVAGAIKHNDSRLSQALEKLLELESNEEDLEERLEDLSKRLEGLYKLKTNQSTRVDKNVLKTNIERFPRIVQKLSTELYPAKPIWLQHVSDIDSTQRELSYLVNRTKEEYDALLKHLSEVTHLAERLQQSEQQLIKINTEKVTLTAELAVLKARVGADSSTVEERELAVLENTLAAVTSLQMNYDVDRILRLIGNGQEATKVLDSVEKAKQRLMNVEASLASVSDMIAHASHADNVTCPNCSHEWNLAVGNIDELQQKFNLLSDQQASLSRWLETASVTASYANDFITVKQKLSDLNDSLGITAVKSIFTLTDLHSGNLVTSLKQQQEIYSAKLRIRTIEGLLNTYDAALSQAERLHESSKDIVNIDPDAVQKKLFALQDDHFHYQQRYKELNRYLDKKQSYDYALVETIDIGNDIEKQQRMLVDEIFSEISEYYIAQYRNALGAIQNKKTVLEVTRLTVEQLKVDRQELKEREEALKVLLAALSPTEGIIAQQLHNAIQGLVADMNQFIEGIWTYDLIIQPCSMENEELSCKFPLLVETPDSIRSDVSRGSSSVKDIINFAFKRLAYRCFKLEGFPLFFDEFGATFDPEHIHRAMLYAQNAHALGEHSAIFMVSHFESYYSNFSDADINVLHAGNVRFEQEHNKCLVIS